MSWQPDPSTVNPDTGEYTMMWVDDGSGTQDTTGSQPIEPTQEQKDRAAAEGAGMTYEDYIASQNNPNYSHEGANTPVGNVTDANQSAAETKRLAALNAGIASGNTNVSAGNSAGSDTATIPTDWLTKLGITDSNGSVNWQKLLAGLGGALTVADGLTSTPKTIKSIAELKAGMSPMNTPAGWTPEQIAFGTRPMQTGSALEKVYAADMKSPVTPGVTATAKKFADGGNVGALGQAFAGAVQGDDGGQSDLIDAKLSPGEYVMDAESVSALGDGNTAAGIAKLDQLRQQLREQKRAAPTGEIPPPAQGPLSYMGGR